MQLLPNGKQSFFTPSGQPLANGKVYFYQPGTSTPATTYQDPNGQTPNANPVILDGNGQAIIYGTGSYRQVVQDANGVTVWDQTTTAPDAGFIDLGNTTNGKGADLVANAAKKVASIAALRALRVPQGSDAQTVILDGYATAGDGGGGVFQWWPNSSTAEDGGIHINPTGNAGNGRWVRADWHIFSPINIKWFGAKVDGTTDDYTAISNTVAYLASVGGGRLLFPRGTTLSGQAVPLRSNITYMGVSGGGSILKAHPNSVDNVIGEATPPSNLLPITGVVIQDLLVDGNQANVSYNTHNSGQTDDAYQNGIRLYQCNGTRLRNVTVQNAVMNGISVYFYCEDTIINDCKVLNTGKATNITSGAKSYNGIWVEFNSQRTRILNTRIDTTRDRGIWVTTGYATSYPDALQDDILLQGNTVTNTNLDGICAQVVDAYGTISNLKIKDNTVKSVKTTGNIGIRVNSYDTTTNSVISNPIVSGNGVTGCAQHGLFIYNNTTQPIVSGNQAYGNTGTGLVMGAINAQVSANISLGNTGGQYSDSGTGTTRGGNIFDTTSGTAINQVGTTGQPAFQNGWVAVGGSYEVVGFSKDASGYVSLQGSMTSGTISASLPVFVLPAGYRPNGRRIFSVSSNGAYGQVIVDPDGSVYPQVGSNLLFSLDNIRFRTGS